MHHSLWIRTFLSHLFKSVLACVSLLDAAVVCLIMLPTNMTEEGEDSMYF